MISSMPKRPELSIILPVYNEEPGVPQLRAALTELLARDGLAETEVIFVDDHSTDGSPALLQQACAEDPRFRYVRLSRNSGSHIAILAGLEHAQGSCAVFLAADLQDPPELIPQMLKLWREGHHIVWAVRERREGISRRERAFSRMFYWLLNNFGQVAFPPRGADFALLDRRVIAPLLSSVGANPSIGAAIAGLGFRQAQVPYTKRGRRLGRSKWNLRKRLKAVADAFVGYSFAPIRLMSYLGLATATCGFLYALIIIAIRLVTTDPIEGWSSLMVVTLVLGGVQLTMLGVLGEYIWRALGEARRSPLYLVESSRGFDAPPPPRPPGAEGADPRPALPAAGAANDHPCGRPL